MALNLEGKKCPVCDSYLFAEDDIVFCPICGLPHHRDCFKAVGHCAKEHLHGTPEQYDGKAEETNTQKTAEEAKPNDESICPNCKNRLKEDMLVCPYCGRPKNARIFTFDALGGIKAGEDLGGGVTAGEAAEFVKINTVRYIPKFFTLKNRKVSWNWAAFLFPEGWFLSRKMYLKGAFFTALTVAAQICTMPLLMLGSNATNSSYAEITQEIIKNLSVTGNGPLILTFIGTTTHLIGRIIAGLFGDHIYKKHVISTITNLKNDDDHEYKLQKKSGVSLIAFLVGVGLATYLPEFIMMLFK